MPRLTLTVNVRDRLIRFAQQAEPLEACGLVFGHGNTGHAALRLHNAHPSSAFAFALDEREILEALEERSGWKQELVAVFHSHPRSDAVPSRLDLESVYPLHIIIALTPLPHLRVYEIADGRALPFDLVIA